MARGERVILSTLLEQRFGATPGWAVERFNQFEVEELEETGRRVLRAQTLEELFNAE